MTLLDQDWTEVHAQGLLAAPGGPRLGSAQDSEGRQPSPGIRSFPLNSLLGSEITERRGAAVTAVSARTATTMFDEPFVKLLRRLLRTRTPGPQPRD